MVDVPAGVITMRDDRLGSRWQVMLQAFKIGATPVTQGLYGSLTGRAPAVHKGEGRPVESVSWIEAVDFCNLLSQEEGLVPCYVRNGEGADLIAGANGYRLPSEAEWEYACRAGTSGPRYGNIGDIAWYKENSGGRPHTVAQKQPNAWGLFDTLGNVWEWCWDVYDPNAYGSYRVFRGGGWADAKRGCLATNRRRSHPTFQIDDLGFRVARTF